MKALVISGGGSLGAWGGGVAESLYRDGNNYDIIIGTSTGALLSSMIAKQDFVNLKKAYTSMCQDDIFDINPFNTDGSINVFNAIWRIIRGKKTLGETHKLKAQIKKYLTQVDFNIIKKSDTEVVCCVYNIEKREAEYKSIRNNSYADYCDWMTASASVPIAMSIIEKDGWSYVDGGVSDHIPIRYLLDMDISHLDVIVHRTETYVNTTPPKNIFNYFMKIIDALNIEISRDDIEMIKDYAYINNINTRIFYLPHKLTSNSLLFDKEEMTRWWDMGVNKNYNLKNFK